ncbi:MAG: hypothetical protein WBP59_04195 [Ilumatobacteraceae bacterium]
MGIGSTDFSKASGRSVLTLATSAARAAISDAGLQIDDVDAVIRCENDIVGHNDIAHALGLRELSYWGSTPGGGAAPSGMIGQAVAAVTAGLATTVLVYRSLNGRSGERYGQGAGHEARAIGGFGSYDEFFMPYGLLTPGQVWALIFRRHMIEFGSTTESLREIALTCRRRANANPRAQLGHKLMTAEDYDNEPIISDPLRKFDFCLETDGASAVIVTSAERARDGAQPMCTITATAQSASHGMQPAVMFPVLMRGSLVEQPSAGVADLLYRRAGIGPDGIDVAQFYDCFTPTVLMQLEDYGFCTKGEGSDFAMSGALELGGSIPINTAGGNLSEGYIHGMSHIVEGVRQIRGSSTSQVDGAKTCLVTSGLPVVSSALILSGSA